HNLLDARGACALDDVCDVDGKFDPLDMRVAVDQPRRCTLGRHVTFRPRARCAGTKPRAARLYGRRRRSSPTACVNSLRPLKSRAAYAAGATCPAETAPAGARWFDRLQQVVQDLAYAGALRLLLIYSKRRGLHDIAV